MTQVHKEQVLDKIIGKLKENASQSGELICGQSLEQIGSRIDTLLQSVKDLSEKNGADQETKNKYSSILSGVENIRDFYLMHKSAVTRAAQDIDTYVYALETLYSDHNGNGAERVVRAASMGSRMPSREQFMREQQMQMRMRQEPDELEMEMPMDEPVPQPRNVNREYMQVPNPALKPSPQRDEQKAMQQRKQQVEQPELDEVDEEEKAEAKPVQEEQKEKKGRRFKFSFP